MRRPIVIIGGSEIGYHTARLLEERGLSPRLIEEDADRARWLAERLPETVVMEHDATDSEFLTREHVDEADIVVAALDSDERNLLVSVLAKRLGTDRVVAIVDNGEYVTVFEEIGIDVAINPRQATAEEIIRFTYGGIMENIAVLENDQAEVLELQLTEASELVGRSIRETVAETDARLVFGAITRSRELIAPWGDTGLQAGDHIVVFVESSFVDDITSMGRIRVDWRASFDLTGRVLLYLAAPLSFPLLVAVLYGEPVLPFVAAIAATLVVGGGLRSLPGDPGNLGPREAFLAVAMIWLFVALIGSLPFGVAATGTLAHPINAVFEAMSGLTTTGATVLEDFSVHSRSVLMWRQFIQWLGGLGILVLATAILSELGVGGAQLMDTETQSRNVDKLTPRISETARLIWGLYLALTALAVVVYYTLRLAGLAPNMDLYNAVAHAFTSVATAGFSPEPLSAGAFGPIVQWAVIPFMIAGSTSFVLMYFAINGEPMRLLKNDEFHFYIGSIVFFATIVAATLFIDPNVGFSGEATVRHAVFNVASMVTTTGYASTDFALWSAAAKHMLFLCMFLGGMVGSTTCSIKSLRWLVALKAFRRDLFVTIHPEAIRPVRRSGISTRISF